MSDQDIWEFVHCKKKLNPICVFLFQHPSKKPTVDVWYDNMPLERNQLGVYANHSLRATTVDVIDVANIAVLSIFRGGRFHCAKPKTTRHLLMGFCHVLICMIFSLNFIITNLWLHTFCRQLFFHLFNGFVSSYICPSWCICGHHHLKCN